MWYLYSVDKQLYLGSMDATDECEIRQFGLVVSRFETNQTKSVTMQM
jgi:hypothetical protein